MFEFLFLFSFLFPFGVVRAVISLQATLRHVHMFVFNFQMGRQASNSSTVCCFIAPDDWLTCLLQIARKLCPIPWDANTLLSEPGCLNFNKEWFTCPDCMKVQQFSTCVRLACLWIQGLMNCFTSWHDSSLWMCFPKSWADRFSSRKCI